MENILTRPASTAKQHSSFFVIILGSGLITLSAFAKIPFFPVPFTLQTLAIFLLGLTLPPRQAMGSALCYLGLATMGFPVFCGASNPFWIVGKCGGYLVAFPIAACMISALVRKKIPSFLALLCGLAVIYSLGFIWLSFFFGSEVALMKGIVLFIPADLLKVLVAVSSVSYWQRWQKNEHRQ